MLGGTASYEIPKVQRYNVGGAKAELYRGAPTTNYGMRERFEMKYTKI